MFNLIWSLALIALIFSMYGRSVIMISGVWRGARVSRIRATCISTWQVTKITPMYYVSLHVDDRLKIPWICVVWSGFGEILPVWASEDAVFPSLTQCMHLVYSYTRPFPSIPLFICFRSIAVPVSQDARDINLTGALGRAHRWSVDITHIHTVWILWLYGVIGLNSIEIHKKIHGTDEACVIDR